MTDNLPLSRPVNVADMGKGGLQFPLEATKDELTALAKELGIVGIDSLEAEIEVDRWRREGAQVKIALKANIRQTCVVSLEDFDTEMEEAIERRFAEPTDKILAPQSDSELILEADSDDIPDVLENGRLDAGGIIAEHLALILDPYPRKPGVNFESQEEDNGPVSPFAVLKGLKPENDQ